MLIIYNVSGLLIGLLGVMAGFGVLCLTGSLGGGAATVAVIWFAASLWWRNHETVPGGKQPYPSLFFIPLPLVAIPVLCLAALMILLEMTVSHLPPDARANQFRADEKMLDGAQTSGDVPVSGTVLFALQMNANEKAKADKFSVFTRTSPDAVLVLVKAPNLKDFSDNARKQMLEEIVEMVRTKEENKDKQIYVGIKGRISFGAIRYPPDVIKTGSVVVESPLYQFYGEVAPPGT